MSGTAAGRSVGVAPGANIFGLKVLNDDGEGDTSGIIEALEFVADQFLVRRKPSVVSMSLGGPCETDDCAEDSLVIVVEELVSLGVVVSVAAGNEGCNACSGSPNSAINAIVSGASDVYDKITYFSNFGQCNDVYSPGLDVISSCAKVICDDNLHYVSFSGTSMACPHTTGVAAQLLQKYASLEAGDVASSLMCSASRNKIGFSTVDSVSKNFLLNVPSSNEEAAAVCNLGADCEESCSGNGVCMSTQTTFEPSCHCDGDWYGSTCDEDRDPVCILSGAANVRVEMTDTVGDGWTFSNYAILDLLSGDVVDNAYDSLCYGSEGAKDYCLSEGCYGFEVSRGYYPEEVSWSFCGNTGGAPYHGTICIEDEECGFICDHGAMLDVQLHDSYGDGWGGAYYNVYGENGGSLYGGTLADGESAESQLCLSAGCYYLMFDWPGNAPWEVSLDICDTTISPEDVARVCIDSFNACSVTMVPEQSTIDTCSSIESDFSILMFDFASVGWKNASFELRNEIGELVANGGNTAGFVSSDNSCLADGCYSFTTANSSNADDLMWLACGERGAVPWTASVCVEKAYGLCYGLLPCPYLKSYAHSSDGNVFMISHIYDDAIDGGGGAYGYYYYGDGDNDRSLGARLSGSEDDEKLIVDSIDNVHAVHNLCGMRDACYRLDIGGGKYSGVDRNTANVCGTDVTFPLSASICFSSNGTDCALSDIKPSSCGPTKVLHKFFNPQ